MAHNTTPSPSRRPKRTEKNWLKFLLTKVNERDMVSHNCSIVVEHVAIQQRKTQRPCYRFIHRNIWIKWGFNINTILLRNALIYLMKIEYPFGYTGSHTYIVSLKLPKIFQFQDGYSNHRNFAEKNIKCLELIIASTKICFDQKSSQTGKSS